MADLTPAEELRAAAEGMRKDANDAREEMASRPAYWGDLPDSAAYAKGVASGLRGPVGDIAAKWTPVLIELVADWLERDAALIDSQVFPQSDPVMERYPGAVARAYLDSKEN